MRPEGLQIKFHYADVYHINILGFSPFIIFTMSSSVKVVLEKDLSPRRKESVGIFLLMLINNDWLAKKGLKISAFS